MNPQHSEEERPPEGDRRDSEPNVRELHHPHLREKDDPEDGYQPVPFWFVAFLMILGFWGGAYMMQFSGGFRADVFNENQMSWVPVAGGAAAKPDPVKVGERLYTANCAACHQATGLGIPGQYPPLVGSELVLGEKGYGENHLAKVVLNGLTGPITILGKTYNNNMPAWKDQMKDEQIAAILTYVRQAWGNAAPPIGPEGIAAMRKEVGSRANPWTDAELKKIPAAPLQGNAAPTP
jgi:mono/diheme cytochrome c family protein